MNNSENEKSKIETKIKRVNIRLNITVPIIIGFVYLYCALSLYNKEMEKRDSKEFLEKYKYDYINEEYVCIDENHCE